MKPFAYEKVSMAEAKLVHDGAPRATRTPDGSKRRAEGNVDEVLLPATSQWIAALPPAVQPRHLAEHYPRIANRLCALWHEPFRCNTYLSDLLIDRRGSRHGFPMLVASEIGRLSAHFATLHADERRWNVAH